MNPSQTNRCTMQHPEDLSASPITEYRTIMNRSFRSPQRVICVGSCVFQGQPESPGSDGASPYRTSSLHSSESERIINRHPRLFPLPLPKRRAQFVSHSAEFLL